MKILEYTRAEWIEKYRDIAYTQVFEKDPSDIHASFFDMAFVVLDDRTESPVIFFTIKQMNEHSIYIEHGGSFPDFRGSVYVKSAFKLGLNNLKEAGAKSVTLSTKTDNVAMQKLALSVGFIPFGLHGNDKGLFLDYGLEFKEGE